MAEASAFTAYELRALEDKALRAVTLDDVSIQSLTPRRAASGE